MIQLFSATYPERVTGLILMGSYSNAKNRSHPIEIQSWAEAQILANWGPEHHSPDFAPDLARDPEFLDWLRDSNDFLQAHQRWSNCVK